MDMAVWALNLRRIERKVEGREERGAPYCFVTCSSRGGCGDSQSIVLTADAEEKEDLPESTIGLGDAGAMRPRLMTRSKRMLTDFKLDSCCFSIDFLIKLGRNGYFPFAQ